MHRLDFITTDIHSSSVSFSPVPLLQREPSHQGQSAKHSSFRLKRVLSWGLVPSLAWMRIRKAWSVWRRSLMQSHKFCHCLIHQISRSRMGVFEESVSQEPSSKDGIPPLATSTFLACIAWDSPWWRGRSRSFHLRKSSPCKIHSWCSESQALFAPSSRFEGWRYSLCQGVRRSGRGLVSLLC